MFDEREKKILQLKNEGVSNEEISRVLFLSLPRVKELSSGIYRKLGVNKGSAAVAKARQLGIIQDAQKNNSSKAEATPREIEVVQLIARARSNEAIALELGIKPSTVRTYISTLLEKFNCKNRIELVSVFVQRGIVKK